MDKETVWKKFQCGGGARWTETKVFGSTVENSICNFSGCNCKTQVKIIGTTTDINEAREWFKRPAKR